MINPYQTSEAIIKEIKEENKLTRLFTLEFKSKKRQKNFFFFPGQFVLVSFPGFGEAPFAICSSKNEKRFFQICVRKVGVLTTKLHSLKVGDEIGVRGPYGNGIFPFDNDKNLLLVAGGLGLIPLRAIILSCPEKKIQLFYGAKKFEDLIFKDEFEEWSKRINLNITLDQGDKRWKGNVGLVTSLFDKVKIIENCLAILCGPPIMYKFVIQKLKEKNLKDEEIYLSLERKMDCGLGICQHCAVGIKYVCKDGPVFRYDQIKNFV